MDIFLSMALGNDVMAGRMKLCSHDVSRDPKAFESTASFKWWFLWWSQDKLVPFLVDRASSMFLDSSKICLGAGPECLSLFHIQGWSLWCLENGVGSPEPRITYGCEPDVKMETKLGSSGRAASAHNHGTASPAFTGCFWRTTQLVTQPLSCCYVVLPS